MVAKRRRRKKKKKKKGSKDMTITTKAKTYGNWCFHYDWLEVGNDGDKVFLKSSGGTIPHVLDVFIDLTGIHNRFIPQRYEKYFRTLKPQIISWEINDGGVCPVLPKAVLRMIKDGLKVGWGCIGGHGRTGWLAAKIHQMLTGCTGDEAANYVRTNYCYSAIETIAQAKDLGAKNLKDIILRGGIAIQGGSYSGYTQPATTYRGKIGSNGVTWEEETKEREDKCPNDCRICNDINCEFYPKDKQNTQRPLNPDCVLTRPCKECEYLRHDPETGDWCYFYNKWDHEKPLKLHDWCEMYISCADCEEMYEDGSGTKKCALVEPKEKKE